MISVILLFILGLFLICFGGDKLVDSSVALAKKIGIPQIVVGGNHCEHRYDAARNPGIHNRCV